jgi:hypothetical protein
MGVEAVAIKHTLPEFSRTADSLEGAMKSAMSSIGLPTPLAWANVGPAIESAGLNAASRDSLERSQRPSFPALFSRNQTSVPDVPLEHLPLL